MKKYIVVTILLSAFISVQDGFARKLEGEGPGTTGKRGSGISPGVAANCSPPTTATELDINNTRALIQTGGDMWWDLVGQARYEIPKGSGRTAMFAGSLWLGGQDVSGQLKVAAQRFRSQGNDFWTGPLSTVDAEITPQTCVEWDRHFLTTRNEVAEFRAWYRCGEDPNCNQSEDFPDYQIPRSILEWPAAGRAFAPFFEDPELAPYVDVDGSGDYNPSSGGDYPRYDLDGSTDCQQRIVDIYGDQNLWWVFNDKGNIHTESNAASIGMEIRAQAFAFATNDEVNNMTFYNYELVNRSSFQLTNTYFGFWVDTDLGNAQDDLVGCDVERGLGYAYNGLEVDLDQGGALGYGDNPPAIGVDFFQGPFQDNDSKDNCLCLNDYNGAIADDGIPYRGLGVGYGDGVVDNERLGMRAFLYHNNDNSNTGDPNNGVEYYNFLRSFWRDNSHMVYGGTGFRGSVSPPFIEADFMFPGTSDPVGWGTDGQPQPEWTEVTANNEPADRRFVQSSGPFVLAPGAVNNITVGVVWSRASSGGRLESVNKLLADDQKTQALFDNCFQLLDGPDAPDVEIVELDRELIIQLSNSVASNNFNDEYIEVDPFIVLPDSLPDDEGNYYQSTAIDLDSLRVFEELARTYRSYTFQGYQIFQLKDESVSASDLFDNTLARLVAQCDMEDDIEDLINFRLDERYGVSFPEPRVENAENEGVKKSFLVTTDLFAEGDNALVNHKTYYFIAIAYAHNEFEPFDPGANEGQPEPYRPSRKSATGGIRVYTGIPHNPRPASGGTVLSAQYGQGVEVTRIEGIGNSGRNLEIKQSSIDEALTGAPWIIENPVYELGAGPIEVKVVDPLSVQEGTYQLAFADSTDNLSNSFWTLFGGTMQEPFVNTTPVSSGSEVLVPELGISVTIKDVPDAGQVGASQNGLVASSITFGDFQLPWLTGIPDSEENNFLNWIRSGNNAEQDRPEYWDYDYRLNSNGNRDGEGLDDEEHFERVAEGTWTPFRLATWNTHGPAANRTNMPFNNNLNGMFGGAFPGNVSAPPAHILAYLNSVNVYFTSDTSKWTRAVVLEMQDDPTLASGGAAKLNPRLSPSVDKNGVPADSSITEGSNSVRDAHYISPTGMGWFPGYAIDVETGERLNIAFGEDSYLRSENGRDMIWNPTSTVSDGVLQNANIRFGGKHYVYVFRNNSVEENAYIFPTDFNDPDNRMPAYDAGAYMIDKLNSGDRNDYRAVYRACSWVGAPLLELNETLLSTDAVVKLRVSKSFQHFANGQSVSIGESLDDGTEYLVKSGPISYDGTEYNRNDIIVGQGTGILVEATGNTGADTVDNLVATLNGGRPLYEFSLDGLAPITNIPSVAEDALDLIDIVPNPYYAYSQYETSKLDNRVRIINLPERCEIDIYTLNGILVRQFTKDDPSVASIDWDLKNQVQIPISSGVYIVHIDVPGVGEKVLKWFGVMRPVDLDSF